MMKSLAICLLLPLLVLGCGKDPAPEDPSASGDGSSQLNNQPEVQPSTGNPEPRPKEPVVVRDKEDVKAAAFTPGLFRGTSYSQAIRSKTYELQAVFLEGGKVQVSRDGGPVEGTWSWHVVGNEVAIEDDKLKRWLQISDPDTLVHIASTNNKGIRTNEDEAKRLILRRVSGPELEAQTVAKPEIRSWKDTTGQFSVEAVFVRVNGDQVVLQRTDKKEISLPLAKLSAADGQYVQEQSPAKTALSAALLGKRVHFKIGREIGWCDFLANGTVYHGEHQDRKEGSGQWSVTGNRLKITDGRDDDYLVFANPSVTAGSEVIFLNSADRPVSEGTRGTVQKVEPIPPPTDVRGPGRKIVIDFMTSMATGKDLEKSTYLSYPKEQFVAWAQASDERKAKRVWDPQANDWELERRERMVERLRQISASLKTLDLDLSTLRITELDSNDDISAELETSSHSFKLRLDDCLQTPRGLLIFDLPDLRFKPKKNRD